MLLTKKLNFYMINNRMKKVKAFLYIFIKSLLPQKKYYSQLVKTPFKFSLKYFSILIILLNLIFLIYLFNFYSYQKIYNFVNNLKKSLETYPSNLAIFIQKNNLFTNNNRPYFLWLKENEKKRLFLAIIETNDKQIIDNLHANIILSKEQITIKNPNNYQTISTININEVPELIIDKKFVGQINNFLQSLLVNLHWYYLFFALVVVLLSPLISFIVLNFYLLIASFFVYAYFKFFKKRHFHFKKVFQISLHAITLPLVLEYLAFFSPNIFFGLKVSLSLSSPFIFPLLMIVIFTLFTSLGVLEAYNHHQQK